MVLRRGGQPPVRRADPSAGVLPHPGGTGDPRGAGRRDRRACSGGDTIVELGSGTSEKTRILLDALSAAGRLERFVPFDVDESILLEAADIITTQYPAVAVHAVVGDFERHLALLPRTGTRMIAFLGSTIGNLDPAGRAVFLGDLRAAMDPGETLLLGVDLVKDPDRIVPAYDDSAGIGTRYSRNMLRVLNAELDADFDVEAFDHVARWNTEQEWLEVGLRSRHAQTATVRRGRATRGVRRRRDDAQPDQREVPPLRHRGRAVGRRAGGRTRGGPTRRRSSD